MSELNNLKNRIRRCGFTIQSFANAVGVSRVYMSRIVNGKVVPSKTVIDKMAEVLHKKSETLGRAEHPDRSVVSWFRDKWRQIVRRDG